MKQQPEHHYMCVRYVRWLTKTDPAYTVVKQIQTRGRCIYKWYIEGVPDWPGAERE